MEIVLLELIVAEIEAVAVVRVGVAVDADAVAAVVPAAGVEIVAVAGVPAAVVAAEAVTKTGPRISLIFPDRIIEAANHAAFFISADEQESTAIVVCIVREAKRSCDFRVVAFFLEYFADSPSKNCSMAKRATRSTCSGGYSVQCRPEQKIPDLLMLQLLSNGVKSFPCNTTRSAR